MAIDIKSQIELLRELQAIDILMRGAEEELAGLPQIIEETRLKLTKSSIDLKQKEAAKAQVEKEKRALEAEVEDNNAHLKEREGKLYAIKTNKEYQAALKEISDSKRVNKQKEDAIIKLMEKIDVLDKEITQLSGKAAEEDIEFKKEEAEFEKKKLELEKLRNEKNAELKIVEERIDKSVLEKYNFIRTRYLEPVSSVVSGICQGCYMNIPPQMYIELLKGLKFHFCPNCHRFICVGDKAKAEGGKEEVEE